MIVWFGNNYGWLWIMISGRYKHTWGYGKKKRIFSSFIIGYLMCPHMNYVVRVLQNSTHNIVRVTKLVTIMQVGKY